MGHADAEHGEPHLGHQVRSVPEFTGKCIDRSYALRSTAHNQRVNLHSLELLKRSRRRRQVGVYPQLSESPSYQMIILSFDVDNRNSCQDYSNSIVAGGLGVMS